MPFITNDGTEQNLRERIIQLVEKSEQLKFLVGFFYFSGFGELYKTLKSRDDDFQLRILVGLNVDTTIGSAAAAEFANTENQTKREIAQSYVSSLPKAINNESSDSQEKYEQLLYFVELLIADKLVIRKTQNPNHSKLYIFDIKPGELIKNSVITGSSNLTSSGLSTQEEFNVELLDNAYEKANNHFESLWDNSIEITENDALKQELLKTIKNQTLIREITPFEAYALVLKIYLESKQGVELGETLKQILKRLGYTSYKYQEDAVKQALKTLQIYDGVIIADVVGLGKSIVASMLAKELDQRGVILCPPGLMPAWKRYLEEFELYSWNVFSSGNIKLAQKHVNEATNSVDVVVVDEAHGFRNEDTNAYKDLKALCRERKVVLLSATPFNNSPGDILSLLELFTIPKKSSITLDGNIKAAFRSFKYEFERLSEIKKHYQSTNKEKRAKAESQYRILFPEAELPIDIKRVIERTSALATQIRSVIEPVAIRRNRLDLINHPDYRNEVTELSEVKSPEPWYFELTPEQSEFYDKVLSEYFADDGEFTGAAYKPFIYQAGIEGENPELKIEENRQYYSERNTSDFMRRLLVKRFESSFGSFKQSIENFIAITEKILRFVQKNNQYILDRQLMEKIWTFSEEELETELVKYAEKLEKEDIDPDKRIFDVSSFAKRDEFLRDIESDINLYEKIRSDLERLDFVANDPKSAALIEKVRAVVDATPTDGEPKRKVIIFTEYRDTANHLKPILEQAFGERVLFSGDMSQQTIDAIRSNFDASLKPEEQEDQYDVLLATDRVSEGFNLNRAGLVVNYDIPWNPVRVIQRVGRINRISKKVFNELYIANFFPTEQGSDVVQSEEIAANKMFMIHNILGEDSRIFHPDEEPTASGLFERLRQDPDEEEEGIETKAAQAYEQISLNHPDVVASLADMPTRVKVAKSYSSNELLVFSRRERLHVQHVTRDDRERPYAKEVPFEDVLANITCEQSEVRKALSDQFWGNYSKAKEETRVTDQLLNEQSVEQRASNLLSTYANHTDQTIRDIAVIFREDITDYGTLALPSLREIVATESMNDEDTRKALTRIIDEQGGMDYLTRIKSKVRENAREIVVAIENQAV